MSYYSRYDKGDWKAICDVCGREYKASVLKQRWDGLMCCPQDWEPRQPQDFVRGVPDPQLVPWVRDEAQDQFIPVTMIQMLLGYLTSTATLIATFIEGPAIQRIFSASSATLSYFKKLPIAPGSREVNGSSINTNSLG